MLDMYTGRESKAIKCTCNRKGVPSAVDGSRVFLTGVAKAYVYLIGVRMIRVVHGNQLG